MGPLFKVADFAIGQGLGKAGPIGKVISTVLSLTGASSSVQDLLDHGVDLSELGERLYEEVHDNWLPNASDPNGTYQVPGGGSISIKNDISIALINILKFRVS